jgi:hypothetical protein
VSEKSGGNSGGIGFCGLLTIVFITLKLCKVIDWSWWWVLAPIWGPAAFAVAIILVGLIIVAIGAMIEAVKQAVS